MHRHLADLFDIRDIQQIQDNFSRLTGMASVLVDGDINYITQPSGEDFGLLLHREGKKQQKALYRKLFQENRISKKPVLSTSGVTGATTGSIPITVGTQQIGSWIIGQVWIDIGDGQLVRQSMLAAGMSQEEVRHALKRLPQVSRPEFQCLLGLLENSMLPLMRMAKERWELLEAKRMMEEEVARLESGERTLKELVQSSDMAFYATDYHTGALLEANEQYVKYTGRTWEELKGKPCWQLAEGHPEGFCLDCPRERLVGENGEYLPPVVVERWHRETGSWIRCAHQVIDWVDGRPAHVVTMTDMTAYRQRHSSQGIFSDTRLNIPSEEELSRDIHNYLASDEIYVICMEIGSLKGVRDAHGPEGCSALMEAVCSWLQERDIPQKEIYQIGRHHFACVAGEMELPVALEWGKRFRHRLGEPWIVSVDQQEVTLHSENHLGIACISRGFLEEEELLPILERTINRAREQGSVAIYDRDVNRQHREKLALDESLRESVRRGMDGFSVLYQPIVDPATGTWCAVEALCRWDSPQLGSVSPLVFIRRAEQLGLIGAIGLWVLETSIRDCKELGLDGLDHFLLDVNLSAEQLLDHQLASRVMGLLEKHRFPGNKLGLELTDSAQVGLTDQTVEAISRLQEAGVQVGLDHFGTGYDNFNALKHLPVSILKTERAFLENIQKDRYLQYLSYLMVELAHAADLMIVAEGVETWEQMRILQENGVDRIQGYLFSRPLSRQQLEENQSKFQGPISPKRDVKPQEEPSPQASKLLGRVACLLFGEEDDITGIRKGMELLAERLCLTKGWIYLWNEEECLCKLLEAGPGEDAMPEQLPPFGMMAEGFWEEIADSSGILLLTDYQEGLGKGLEKRGVKSSLVIPLGELGYGGFEDGICYREWAAEERRLLQCFCRMICKLLESSTAMSGMGTAG